MPTTRTPGDRTGSGLGTRDPVRPRRPPLDALFQPAAVAVIGPVDDPASPAGRMVRSLVESGFSGAIVPVAAASARPLGLAAVPSLAVAPQRVDLAIVAVPAGSAGAAIVECADAGVGAAIVTTDADRSAGPGGGILDRRALEIARHAGLRLLGPGSLGVMRPAAGLNAMLAPAMARRGSVAFLGQSGAVCAAVLDWSRRERVGFSACVSVGTMADVGWGDLIDYLGHDPETRSILIYMESVGDARAFLSAAREVALTRPIIAVRTGRSLAPLAPGDEAADRAGCLAGHDEVLDAALRRCGVLRVDHLADLFYMAEVLGKQPRPRGPRLAIVSNAGGPATLAADALVAHGGQLADLGEETVCALDGLEPPPSRRGNPVDVGNAAGADRYARAVELVGRDPHADAVLAIFAPQAGGDATAAAERVAALVPLPGRPILASWMGGPDIAGGEAILNGANVPTFAFPDTAARVFANMWRHSRMLKALYETPVLPAGLDAASRETRERAAAVIATARGSKRRVLAGDTALAVLDAYGIPVAELRRAHGEEEAVAHALAIGFPVTLESAADDASDAPDACGCCRELTDEGAVRAAYRWLAAKRASGSRADAAPRVAVRAAVPAGACELRLASGLDPEFGPVIVFGAGGPFAEALRDRAVGLPPLNTTLARRLMEQTRVFAALEGRGVAPACDVDAMAGLLVRFSHLVCEQPWIRAIDVNPLLASPARIVAREARLELHGPEVEATDLPRPAIRPYPTQYVAPYRLKNGVEVLVRPIRPEDEPLMVAFHETLSDRTVFFRYFHVIKLGERISHDRLTRTCFIDYDREMALVAERRLPDGPPRILGVGRLTKARGQPSAEFAIVVTDEMQGQGLGTELLRRLVAIGRDERVARITGDILPENRDMQHVAEKVGFTCRYDPHLGVVRAEFALE